MRRSSPVKRGWSISAAFVLGLAATASAVIHLDTGDPAAYASSPGDNSGWQFEGRWGGFLGTPVAPFYFLSAGHIGQAGGNTFVFHGETFQVLQGYFDPDTDLCLWRVDHAFSTYAPLFQPEGSGNAEIGRELRVFGCGTQRGAEVSLDDSLRGWFWGGGDGVERWGRNTVADVVPSSATWFFLKATFDASGPPGEAHLSVGDSGGGLFVLQEGLWRLAAINYGVDDLYTAPSADSGFVAAVFDARGYYERNDDGSFHLFAGDVPHPTAFYSTQVSSRLDWIRNIVGAGNVNALPTENFGQWAHAYFTPDQRADDSVAGPGADPDGDGVPNLLEFAFNLDPTFAEPAVMTADTGLRGLPLVRLEGERLTVEFVRRRAEGGAGITYAAQFAVSLDPAAGGWQMGGTENVTAINARWERVKVTDDGATPARFARVLVSESDAGRKN